MAETIEIETCLSAASLSRFRDCFPRNERNKSAVSGDWLIANFPNLIVKPQSSILFGDKKAADDSAAFAMFGYGISIA